jgi:hypothetical protein
MPSDAVVDLKTHQRLRPEFVKNYKKKLNADALVFENPEDDEEIMEASKYLQNSLVDELTENLDTIETGLFYKG